MGQALVILLRSLRCPLAAMQLHAMAVEGMAHMPQQEYASLDPAALAQAAVMQASAAASAEAYRLQARVAQPPSHLCILCFSRIKHVVKTLECSCCCLNRGISTISDGASCAGRSCDGC